MAECKDCIHFCVCSPYTAPNESYPEVDGCKCFRATADVVPKSEVDEWYHEYHVIKEALKQEKMYHRATEKLADRYCAEFQTAKKEVAREIFEEIEKIAKTVAYPETLVNGMIVSHVLDGLYLESVDFHNLKNKYSEEKT